MIFSFNILEVKPKAVCGDQVVANGAIQDGNNTKLAEGPMDKVSTMLPTVWFGAQSGRWVYHNMKKYYFPTAIIYTMQIDLSTFTRESRESIGKVITALYMDIASYLTILWLSVRNYQFVSKESLTI